MVFISMSGESVVSLVFVVDWFTLPELLEEAENLPIASLILSGN